METEIDNNSDNNLITSFSYKEPHVTLKIQPFPLEMFAF